MSSEEPELPVAAKVTAVGGMPDEGAAIQNFVQISEGDELVKKSDAQEAKEEARQAERQRILDKVETIYEKYSEGNTLFYSYERSAIRPFVEDLRDELEEEVE